jgi:hypothetical protein
MNKATCTDVTQAKDVYRYKNIKELHVTLIKSWLIIYGCVCRCLYDVVILVHGYEQDKRTVASEIILHLWECDLLHCSFYNNTTHINGGGGDIYLVFLLALNWNENRTARVKL